MSEGLAPVDDRQRQPDERGTALLDVLGDECSRRILAATTERPMTVEELTERCPVSSTTVYRRINMLVDHGLLREKPSFPADGTSKKSYESTVDRIETLIDNEGFTVRTYGGKSDQDRIADLLSDIPSDQIRASVDDGELQLTVPLSGKLLGTVAGRGIDDE